MSTRKWLSPVPGEVRWPACRCNSLITSRRVGANARCSFSRMVASTDICTLFTAAMPGSPTLWPTYNGHGIRATPILCAPQLAHILGRAMKFELEILRLRPRQSRTLQGRARGGAVLPVEGLQRPPASTGRPEAVGTRASITCSASITSGSSMPPTITSHGMSNADIEAYQKDSVTGHRPTWKAGANSWAHGTRHGMEHVGGHGRRFSDPHGFFSWRSAGRRRRAAPHPQAAGAKVTRIARFAGHGDPRGDQGTVQGAGKTPPPRRQWRGQKVRRQVARNHPSL